MAGETPALPFSTRLTVASLTPEWAAMSAIRVVMAVNLSFTFAGQVRPRPDGIRPCRGYTDASQRLISLSEIY
ncbi:hypothetical protein Pta02_81050 [Planobispora takensis]|uniref:Uncharacterized protein n=1 Tax=Planobispora takensis TaxID=1367882 RepID=A0A8J3X0U6_9ACTN|nr:hypothetical protein Pta02_81050 [Planobispora takensis]